MLTQHQKANRNQAEFQAVGGRMQVRVQLPLASTVPPPPLNQGTFEQCGAARKHNVGEQHSAEVQVGLVDGKGQYLVEPFTLVPYQVWLEQQLRGPESCWPHLWTTKLR